MTWFWSKNGHFSTFLFLGTLGQENVFYDILEQENAFLGYKNNKFKNCHFCMVLVQKWSFFQIFFLGNTGQDNVFYDILEWKNAFLGYKNHKFKKLKNWHGFGPKMAIFPTFFFFFNLGQENIYYNILEWKTTFYAIKTRSSKIDMVQKWPFF